jgi:hypothetical protein
VVELEDDDELLVDELVVEVLDELDEVLVCEEPPVDEDVVPAPVPVGGFVGHPTRATVRRAAAVARKGARGKDIGIGVAMVLRGEQRRNARGGGLGVSPIEKGEAR